MTKIKKYNGDKSIFEQYNDKFILYDNNFELNEEYRKQLNNKDHEERLDNTIKQNKELAGNIILHNNDIVYYNWNYYWIFINKYTYDWGPETTIRKLKLSEGVNYSIKDEETKPHNANDDKGWYWTDELAQMQYMIDGHWIPRIRTDLSNYKVVHNMTEGNFIIPKLSFIDKVKKLLSIKN